MRQLMQLAFVPSHEPRRWPISEAAGVGLVIALSTILAVVARVLQLDEAASDRVQMILLIIGLGAFFSAFFIAIFAGRFAFQWPRLLRAIFGSILVSGLFIPTVMFFFAFENRIIQGNLEPNALELGRWKDLFWSMFGAMGLFTPTGMRYLIPWPLLIIGLTTALLFYIWPSKRDKQI
jgi:hypothetical protein